MKVPKPRHLPSGSWFIQLRLGGQSVPVTAESERACIRDAQAIKAAWAAQKVLPDTIEPEPEQEELLTLDMAIDAYITSRDAILSPSTIRGYRAIQNHRFPELMDRDIHSIKDEEWQGIINIEAGRAGATTVRKAFSFIRSVIAQQTGHSIPIEQLTLPVGAPAVRDFLRPDEIPKFVSAVQNTDVAIPALLALSSLRLSEIYGLRWEAIPKNPKMIRVAGAVVRDETGKLVYKAQNKNRSSTRNVPMLIPELGKALERERRPEGFVVNWSQTYLRKRIHAICREAKVTDVTIHGLRHSFASLAYHLKVPERIAMEIGGWADQATMHNIYTHIARSDVAFYESALGDFFANKNANKKTEH